MSRVAGALWIPGGASVAVGPECSLVGEIVATCVTSLRRIVATVVGTRVGTFVVREDGGVARGSLSRVA